VEVVPAEVVLEEAVPVEVVLEEAAPVEVVLEEAAPAEVVLADQEVAAEEAAAEVAEPLEATQQALPLQLLVKQPLSWLVSLLLLEPSLPPPS
jgi:hypothetical protein